MILSELAEKAVKEIEQKLIYDDYLGYLKGFLASKKESIKKIESIKPNFFGKSTKELIVWYLERIGT